MENSNFIPSTEIIGLKKKKVINWELDYVLDDPTTQYEHMKTQMHSFVQSAWMGWISPLRDAYSLPTPLVGLVGQYMHKALWIKLSSIILIQA